ncbi:hypothetical protein DFAR_20002 [Desulfarculales bacterium]
MLEVTTLGSHHPEHLAQRVNRSARRTQAGRRPPLRGKLREPDEVTYRLYSHLALEPRCLDDFAGRRMSVMRQSPRAGG